MRRIGQAGQLWQTPLAEAVATRDPAPLRALARRQRAAGAHGLDLNLGLNGDPVDLAWAANVVAEAVPGLERWLDCGDPAVLRETLLELARRGGTDGGRVVVNALPGDLLPPGGRASVEGAALLEAASVLGAGIVLSPRPPGEAAAPSSVEELVDTIESALAALRRLGSSTMVYVDCMAFPALSDPTRCRRSLRLLRELARLDIDTARPVSVPGPRREAALPLLAIGNVGYGAPPALRRVLELVYAAAAVGSGARALLLPAASSPLRALLDRLEGSPGDEVRAMHGDAALVDWLGEVARATAAGWQPPAPARALGDEPRQAWELLFDSGVEDAGAEPASSER